MTDAAALSTDDEAEGGATGPPLIILFLAVVCVIVGAGLVPIDDFGIHVMGYVISSIVTILAIGVFRRVDLGRRLSTQYRPRPALRRVVPVVLIASFVVAGLHVWAIATELAS